MTLAGLRAALDGGEVSRTELFTQTARAMADLNTVLNLAIPAEDGEGSDVAPSLRGVRKGALDGIPLAHKDMFDRRDHRCSFGARMRQQRPPRRTATAITRLEAAGAVTFGALQMAEYALGPTGHNLVFGDCRNPWNPDHVTGGSSSGSAAAVAAGIVAGSLGSDTGGSIRLPAACCGVTGLKPSWGAVDAAGAMPLSASLDCVGPIARSVDDCALLFDLIAARPPAKPFDGQVRIGYAVRAAGRPVSPIVEQAVRSAVDMLAATGMPASEAVLPDIARLHGLADLIQKVDSSTVHLAGLQSRRHLYSEHVRKRLSGGLFVPAIAYHQALRERPAHVARFVRQSMADIDVLVIPTLAFPTPTRAETDERRLAGTFERVAAMTGWTRWLSYLGVPVLALPCGIDANGMPIGMQLVGRPNSEHLLFHVGRIFQSVTDWHMRKPPHFAHIL